MDSERASSLGKLSATTKKKRVRQHPSSQDRRGGKFLGFKRTMQEVEADEAKSILSKTSFKVIKQSQRSQQSQPILEIPQTNKELFDKLKYKNSVAVDKHDLRGACRVLKHCFGIPIIKVASKLKLPRATAGYWTKKPSLFCKYRQSPTLITDEMKEFIKEYATNKWTVVDQVNLRTIQAKLRAKFGTEVSKSTIQRFMHTYYGYALCGKKTFLLTPDQKVNRLKFCDWIEGKNIKGEGGNLIY